MLGNRSFKVAAFLAIVPSLVGLWASRVFCQQAAPAARIQAESPTDALTTLNMASRAAYMRAKTVAIAKFGPLVFVQGDNLILRNAGQREEVKAVPPMYHHLKALAHIPLALDVLLAAHASDKTPDATLVEELRAYRVLVAQAERTLGEYGFNAEQIDRQRTIISAGLKLIDSIVGGKMPSPEERIEFARRMNPLVLNNTAEAARSQIDAYQKQMMAWKARMTPEEWNRLTVVVMGMALPRKGNLQVQYFARLLGEPGESDRIVYSESVYDEAKAIDSLGTRAVDTQIGIDFFNDPTRMHRDLLSDAATTYLPLILDRR